MRVIEIDNSSILPVDYSHVHDSKIKYKRYRENFAFGLSVNQYYFDEVPKDKKTNFNTQYTLTNLYPLSSIIELSTPYTTQAVSSFSSTIKQDGLYLKTTILNTSVSAGSLTSSFVSELCSLSSRYVYTFNVSSVSADHKSELVPGMEDRISVSTEYEVLKPTGAKFVTYYLSSGGVGAGAGQVPITDCQAVWTSAGPTWFKYTLNDGRISLLSPDDNSRIGVHGNNLQLSLSGSSNYTTYLSALSTTFFEVTRHELTKDQKNIPNNYTKYVSAYNLDTVDLNTTTVTEHISNNYFLFSNNYNFLHRNEENKLKAHLDIFPLKNQATLHEYYAENNHFNAEPGYLNRIYEKINAGTHQQGGYDKINLSYNIGTYDLEFKPNKLTYFTTPNSIAPYTKLNIADSKIENLGAVPGDNPLMSDKVFKRREKVKNNSYSDNTDPVYLCSWLSGSSDGTTKWVDRYYNPLVSNFVTALTGTSYYKVVTAAGAQTTETFDVSSSLTFEPNNDYIYYHVGHQDYENLFIAYSKYNVGKDIEYINYKGVPITVNKVNNDDELILNGENFGRLKTDVTGDFSVGFWLHNNDYTQPLGYQIFGNYFEEGFGIFNTDLVTPNIILPTANPLTGHLNRLLFLNNDFEVYDEVLVLEGNEPVTIKGIARKDNFSEFYVLGANNIIYVYNSNNNLISKIEDLKNSNAVIEDLEVGEEAVHVLFNPAHNKKRFTYNFKNNVVRPKNTNFTTVLSSETKGIRGKILDVNNEITVYEVDDYNGFGNEIALDKNNTPYIIKQDFPNNKSIIKNYLQKGLRSDQNEKVISGLDKDSVINGVLVDDIEQLIVLHDNNIISILDTDRKLIRTRQFCNLDNAIKIHTSYIDIICDFEEGVYKKYILLIQEFNDGFRLTKLNNNLKIISSKKFYGEDLLDLKLTKSVTSYSYLKKTGAEKNRFKIFLKTKPKFSSSGVIPRDKTTLSFDVKDLTPGYNHFFVNVSVRHGYMELFVNGRKAGRQIFRAGKYVHDNILGTGSYLGAVSTPFYLTLANRLLQPTKYFINNAKIKGFKLYNKTMSYYDIQAHLKYHYPEKNVIWSYPIGQRTYVETIDKLTKFNYPEKISNKYRVEIKNTGIEDNKLKEKIKERVTLELKKITPYYDELENIIID